LSQIDDYIQNRLDDQINWYETKAKLNKLRYRITEIIIIVAGALIPFINSSVILFQIGNIPQHYLIFIASTLGFIITVVTGFSKMEKYFETWILYRTNAEVLKKEKFLYKNNAAQYAQLSQEDRDKTLVENIEFIVSSEITKYFSMQERIRESTIEKEKKLQDNQKETQSQLLEKNK
jgi:hypothetical protein